MLVRAAPLGAAALVIQGSACIYSKKVEHLYELVYNVLNQVVDEKKKREGKQKKSVDSDGVDKDTEELTQEETFLTLDDDIKEVDNFMLPTVSRAPDSSSFTLVRTPLTLLPAADKEDAGCKMGACEMHSSGAPCRRPSAGIPGGLSASTLCARRARRPIVCLRRALAPQARFCCPSCAFRRTCSRCSRRLRATASRSLTAPRSKSRLRTTNTVRDTPPDHRDGGCGVPQTAPSLSAAPRTLRSLLASAPDASRPPNPSTGRRRCCLLRNNHVAGVAEHSRDRPPSAPSRLAARFLLQRRR